MIRMVLIWAFFMVLMLPTFLSQEQMVTLRFWINSDPVELPLKGVIFIFTFTGMFFTIILALLDRAKLTHDHRKTRKEIKALEQEVTELRHLVTLDQDIEGSVQG